MKIPDLMTPEEKKIIQQAYDAAKNIQEMLTTLVNAGYPYTDHLTKANEQCEWLGKTKALFEI